MGDGAHPPGDAWLLEAMAEDACLLLDSCSAGRCARSAVTVAFVPSSGLRNLSEERFACPGQLQPGAVEAP